MGVKGAGGKGVEEREKGGREGIEIVVETKRDTGRKNRERNRDQTQDRAR